MTSKRVLLAVSFSLFTSAVLASTPIVGFGNLASALNAGEVVSVKFDTQKCIVGAPVNDNHTYYFTPTNVGMVSPTELSFSTSWIGPRVNTAQLPYIERLITFTVNSGNQISAKFIYIPMDGSKQYFYDSGNCTMGQGVEFFAISK